MPVGNILHKAMAPEQLIAFTSAAHEGQTLKENGAIQADSAKLALGFPLCFKITQRPIKNGVIGKVDHLT